MLRGGAPLLETVPREPQARPAELAAPPSAPAARTALPTYHPRFDGLRFALAAGVFLAHAPTGHALPDALGNFCVQVFFALSGFLIGGILQRGGARDLPKFFFQRCTRIWIPYAIALAAMLVVCAGRGQPMDAKWREFVFYKLTFVYNLFGAPQIAVFKARMPMAGTWNHLWSICVEEQFYLLSPLALRLLPSRKIAIGLMCVAALAWPAEYAALCGGMVLAASEIRWRAWYRGRIRLATAAVAIAGAFAAGGRVISYDHWAWVSAVALVALCAGPGREVPGWKWLGGISYPFYLNHWTGLFLVKTLTRLTGSVVLIPTVVAFAVSTGVAAGHYALVDRNVLARRSRWYTPARGSACATAGYALLALGLAISLMVYRTTGVTGGTPTPF